jgi:hypothetical protein
MKLSYRGWFWIILTLACVAFWVQVGRVVL